MKISMISLKRDCFLFAFFAIFIILGVNSIPLSATTNSVGVHRTVVIGYVSPTTVVIDGSISLGEYPTVDPDVDTGMKIYFSHDGEDLYVGLESPGLGWVAIGFGPLGIGMDGANILIGYVKDDRTILEDHIGEGLGHYNDTHHVGGSYDIKAAKGSENTTHTIMEFSFPLSSGDHDDHAFLLGETYGFFVGYHSTADDVTSLHDGKSESLPLLIEMSSILLPRISNSKVNIDGSINPNEYNMNFTEPTTDITVFMEHNVSDMFIGIQCPFSGSVSIAFHSKKDFSYNIIQGFVNTSGLYIGDFFNNTGNTIEDTDNGGTNDIKASAGKEVDNITTIEFIFPMSSSDVSHDHNFSIGQTFFFHLAHHPSADNFTAAPLENSRIYDLKIMTLESVTSDISLTVVDDLQNALSNGDTVNQGTIIHLTALLEFNKEPYLENGTLLNFYIDSTFGLMLDAANKTDSNNEYTFSYDTSQSSGELNLQVELPTTIVGDFLLETEYVTFQLNIVPIQEPHEPYFLDNPQLMNLISIGILIVASSVFITYIYVLFNASRISRKKKV